MEGAAREKVGRARANEGSQTARSEEKTFERQSVRGGNEGDKADAQRALGQKGDKPTPPHTEKREEACSLSTPPPPSRKKKRSRVQQRKRDRAIAGETRARCTAGRARPRDEAGRRDARRPRGARRPLPPARRIERTPPPARSSFTSLPSSAPRRLTDPTTLVFGSSPRSRWPRGRRREARRASPAPPAPPRRPVAGSPVGGPGATPPQARPRLPPAPPSAFRRGRGAPETGDRDHAHRLESRGRSSKPERHRV